MTAVTEFPLPPHSGELKTNKPTAIGRRGEIVCVCLCVCSYDPLVVELQCEWEGCYYSLMFEWSNKVRTLFFFHFL